MCWYIIPPELSFVVDKVLPETFLMQFEVYIFVIINILVCDNKDNLIIEYFCSKFRKTIQ